MNKIVFALMALATAAIIAAPAAAQNTGLEFVYGAPKAPALVAPLHDSDDSFDLKTLGGKVVLVNFWGTWCPPCRAEMPSIARLKARFKDRPFEIVAVHVGRAVKTLRNFATSHLYHWTSSLRLTKPTRPSRTGRFAVCR